MTCNVISGGKRKSRRGGAETKSQCDKDGGRWNEETGVCEPTEAPMSMGAARRKSKSRKARKLRGGVFYGVGAPISVGALEYSAVSGSKPYSSSTGAAVSDPFDTTGKDASVLMGGRRRTRKGKKGSKKSRKTKKVGRRHRKMRGGAGVYNAASVGTSFTGAVSGMSGSQTYGGYTGYASKVPVGGPTQNPDGVYRA
jgi:hypothetical protein